MVELAWRQHAAEVFRYFLRGGAEAAVADDLCQDTFAALVCEADRFDGRPMLGWLLGLARFERLTWLSDRKREQVRLLALTRVEVGPAEAVGAQRIELAELVRDLAEGLTPDNVIIAHALVTGEDDAEIVLRLRAATGRRWNENMVRLRRKRLRGHARARYGAYLARLGVDR